VEWLVAVATFLVCVDIWHEYLMTVLSHVWLPGLLDSLVPFAFLVTELLMVHFVGEDLRGWLLGYGLVALVGVAAWAQRNVRIRQFAEKDRDLPLPWGSVVMANSFEAVVIGSGFGGASSPRGWLRSACECAEGSARAPSRPPTVPPSRRFPAGSSPVMAAFPRAAAARHRLRICTSR
jgi:hypothetical protein